MSERTPVYITAEIAGDWWVLVGVLIADLTRAWFQLREAGSTFPTPRLYSKPLRQGYTIDIYGALPSRPFATIVFQSTPQGTAIHVTTEARLEKEWEDRLKFLDAVTKEADAARQLATPSYNEVIERFYRARVQGSRITLRQLAEETGLSYAALRKRKMAYDQGGGYGAKSKKLKHDETNK